MYNESYSEMVIKLKRLKGHKTVTFKSINYIKSLLRLLTIDLCYIYIRKYMCSESIPVCHWDLYC